MASFKLFAELPKELRDTIWDYASQRNLAGVQIFELRTAKPTEDGEASDPMVSGTRPPRQQLDAPSRSKCFPALDGSPGTSNVSRYMADIGLWTAYLFVIQPSKIEDINWSQVARDIRKQLEPSGFRLPINIGIEWNVEWGIKDNYDDFDVLCQAFRDIHAQLWIIDHNLKRRGDIGKNKINSGTKVFYACDRRFIEVYWKNQPLEHWRYIQPPERRRRYAREHESSIGLARDLHSTAEDDISDWRLYGQYGEDEDRRFNYEVKLLGWDDL
ncbi:hypothetical protein FGLOB1_9974 [Fusarium globosum]|uniref:2EXR domain-containing protein n=1 Tax=Fusarium globosum TaxID=78864 RepID=A0A8H6D2E2_9HYPO|nr:hypothetical protein FGLOB1_9974 [Fusarium globosum]